MVPQRYMPEMPTEKNLHPVYFQDIVGLIIRSFDDAYTLHTENYTTLPVVPHKAAAEVSKIGNL